jgi:hypothetical protein
MTDVSLIAPHAVSGKHNMASDAFEALRTARQQGKPAPGQGMSFSDLLDTLNPLQHIPLVAQAYRGLTGDTISPQARVAGGALYGGAVGLVLSVADAAIEAVSGEDIGGHAMAGLFGGKEPATAVAAKTEAPAALSADTTGSVVPSATSKTATQAERPAATQLAAKMPPQPMPQLSPDAFNALIGSFADPKAAKAANTEMAAKAAASVNVAKTARTTIADAAGKPQDLLGAMQANLDQLDALKLAHPELPVAAFTSGSANGL